MTSKSSAAHSMQRDSIESTEDLAHPVLFARSTGLPASMGKSTATVKTLVPELVKEDFDRLARELGTTPSDFLRDMVLVRLYGVDHVASMQREQLRNAAGIGTERAIAA